MPTAAASSATHPFLVARATIQNAADLLQDAELLARRARWGTAYALAALAFEEIGKTILYLSPFTNPTTTQAELGKDLRSHPTKLTAALSLLHLLGAGQSEPIASAFRRAATLAPKVHKAKTRGFYVDAAANGTYRTPAEVTETEAVELIRDLSKVVDVLRSWLTEEALERLNEIAGPYAEEFRQLAALGGQLAIVDPAKAAEYARDMLNGWIPEVEEESR
jgi:AbiV family abortive infection protein